MHAQNILEINLLKVKADEHNTVYKLTIVLGQTLTNKTGRFASCRGGRLMVSAVNVPPKISLNGRVLALL